MNEPGPVKKIVEKVAEVAEAAEAAVAGPRSDVPGAPGPQPAPIDEPTARGTASPRSPNPSCSARRGGRPHRSRPAGLRFR